MHTVLFIDKFCMCTIKTYSKVDLKIAEDDLHQLPTHHTSAA